MVQETPLALEALNSRAVRGCVDLDTTGFSRVVPQLLPNKDIAGSVDTTDFSRVEFQFLPLFTFIQGQN